MNAVVEAGLAPVVAAPPQKPGALVAKGPMELLEAALQGGASMEVVERVTAWAERMQALEARRAYHDAMAEFKAEPLVVYKTKEVAFAGTRYMHAELADVTGVVVPAMARHGLSHGWSVDQQPGGQITVTCTVTHRAGHSESVSLSAAPDDSGKKNAIQQVASAITYMQRYTLLAICGLATQDVNKDDDGRGAFRAKDAQLVEALCEQAEAADDTSVLRAIWTAGLAAIGNVGPGYDAFKDAVNKRRKELAPKGEAK